MTGLAPLGEISERSEKTPRPLSDLYLRLSDARKEEALEGREARLRAEADPARLAVHEPPIIENDLTPGANGNGRRRPASAFKRSKIRLPSGKVELRTVRPGFRRILPNLKTASPGRARGRPGPAAPAAPRR